MKRLLSWVSYHRSAILWVACFVGWMGFCAYIVYESPALPERAPRGGIAR